MKSEWDKLCAEMDQVIIRMKLWGKIKAEGDKLQEKADKWDLLETKNPNRLKAIDLLVENTQKLEAIRELTKLWGGYRYEKHAFTRLEIKQLIRDILEVLGE